MMETIQLLSWLLGRGDTYVCTAEDVKYDNFELVKLLIESRLDSNLTCPLFIYVIQAVEKYMNDYSHLIDYDSTDFGSWADIVKNAEKILQVNEMIKNHKK